VNKCTRKDDKGRGGSRTWYLSCVIIICQKYSVFSEMKKLCGGLESGDPGIDKGFNSLVVE